jgi:hypothetical protein
MGYACVKRTPSIGAFTPTPPCKHFVFASSLPPTPHPTPPLSAGLVTEGTVGSTGISLAMCAAALGCRCFIAMPDDAAEEKSQILEALGEGVGWGRMHAAHVFPKPAQRRTSKHIMVCTRPTPSNHAPSSETNRLTASYSSTIMRYLNPHPIPPHPTPPHPTPPPVPAGAEVQRLRPVSITHPDHFVNVARRRAAAEGAGAVFADQFENGANFAAHVRTGEEIWAQCGGRLDAFVCGAGTGGTIAGVGAYLKSRRRGIKVFLIDPPGSSLYNKVGVGGGGGMHDGRG